MRKLYVRCGTFYDLHYCKLDDCLWYFYHPLVGWRVSGNQRLTGSDLLLVGNNFKLKGIK